MSKRYPCSRFSPPLRVGRKRMRQTSISQNGVFWDARPMCTSTEKSISLCVGYTVYEPLWTRTEKVRKVTIQRRFEVPKGEPTCRSKFPEGSRSSKRRSSKRGDKTLKGESKLQFNSSDITLLGVTPVVHQPHARPMVHQALPLTPRVLTLISVTFLAIFKSGTSILPFFISSASVSR